MRGATNKAAEDGQQESEGGRLDPPLLPNEHDAKQPISRHHVAHPSPIYIDTHTQSTGTIAPIQASKEPPAKHKPWATPFSLGAKSSSSTRLGPFLGN